MITILIPAHNEAARLTRTIPEIHKFCIRNYEYEIIVVANGCSDNTAGFARSHGCRVINVWQPGKGLALRMGVEASHGDFIYMCDADLSTPIYYLHQFMINSVFDAIVIGSREIQGAIRYNEPTRRHVAGRVFNLLIKLLTNLPYTDTQCGFKLFRAAAAKDIFSRCTVDGFAIDVEVLYLARQLGYSVIEQPIEWWADPDSRVHLLRDSWRMFRDILRIANNDDYAKKVPAAREI